LEIPGLSTSPQPHLFISFLLQLLEKGNKLVLEQVVTTLASVADTAEERFIHHYDRFIPCLKYIVQHAVSPELKLLRGKTIECISLIGLAVGKDKVTLFSKLPIFKM
jgi:hypothetical protein